MAGFAEFLAVEAVLDKRWPETKMEPSLDRIADLVELLGDPQRGYPVVHLTGTNGKTSTARMVDALLSEIGLRTGRYTSPHLQSATERINIDNRPITPERYVEVYRDVAPFVDLVDARHEVPLSKFEVLTAMAFAAFADAPVEAGIVEVGLGGRWDATNVVDGTVAVITPIGLDHAEYLGTDVLGIAREKAGIIKPGAVAVLAAQDRAVAEVLVERCAEVGAQVAREGAEFGVRERELAVGGQRIALQGLSGSYDDIFLPLHGEHQAANAALALAAAEALAGAGPRSPLDPEAVRAAFAAVRSPGRLERVAAGADVADGPGRRRAQPARRPRARRRPDHRVPVHPAGRRWSRRCATRTCAGSSPSWSRWSPRSWSRRTPRRARWTRTSWARSPSSVFGSERVSVEPVLDAGDRAGPRARRGGGHVREPGSSSPARWSRRGRRGGCSGWSRHDAARRRMRPGPTVPDPTRGLRGVYAAVLVLEAIVVGLALLVLPKFGVGATPLGVGLIGGLAVAMVVASGLQRRPWGLGLALGLQVATIACGLLVPALARRGPDLRRGLGRDPAHGAATCGAGTRAASCRRRRRPARRPAKPADGEPQEQ